jgi:hypothetical protein
MQIRIDIFHHMIRMIRLIFWLGLVLAVTIYPGCTIPGQTSDNLNYMGQSGGQNNKDMQLLEKGFSAYANNKSTKAVENFLNLYENSNNVVIRRQALYGLFICRLREADTPEEFKEARLLWQEWRRSRPIIPGCEDPAYLEPFIMPKFSNEEEKETQAMDRAIDPEKMASPEYQNAQNRNRYLETNIKILEKKYSVLKVENDALTRDLNKKNAIIRTLHEKIKALEDIDQKIQEKKNKTEVSSPE